MPSTRTSLVGRQEASLEGGVLLGFRLVMLLFWDFVCVLSPSLFLFLLQGMCVAGGVAGFSMAADEAHLFPLSSSTCP